MCMLRQGCSLSMLHRTCEKLHGGLGWFSIMGVLDCFNGVGVLGWLIEHAQLLVHALLF